MSIVNTKMVIEHYPQLDDRIRAQLLTAISSRGKFKGYILANEPNQKERATAWNALIGNINPQRLRVSTIMWRLDGLEYARIDDHLVDCGIMFWIRASEPMCRWEIDTVRRFDVGAIRAHILDCIDNDVYDWGESALCSTPIEV